MAKSRYAVQGIYTAFRSGKKYDALRVYVRPENGEQFPISAKTHPTLKQLNKYLKEKQLRKAEALSDNSFNKLLNRLISELKSEHGLKSYRIQERLELQRKGFNWDTILDEFEEHKSEYTIGASYRSRLEKFWLPFFISEMQCEHPREFRKHQREALNYIKSAKTAKGKLYSHNTWKSLAKPLNEFIKFCTLERDSYGAYISKEDGFYLEVKPLSVNQLKAIRAREIKTGKKEEHSHNVRTRDTYSIEDWFEIKGEIDLTYKENLEKKLRAYGLLFGVFTGIRRANLLGVRASDLHPESSTPYFEINSSVIRGYGKDSPGLIELPGATKTTIDEAIKIPFLAPDKSTLVEVATFLKTNLKDEDRIVPCFPDTVGKWWKAISKECNFRYLNPHAWRHSFVTVASLHLDEWFGGNKRLLQRVCLHASFRTTENYIQDRADQFIQAFERLDRKSR